MASFALAYAMENIGWKFYFINAAWDFVFLVIAYFTFVETKGLKLEEINVKFEGPSNVIVGIEEDSSSQNSIAKGRKLEHVVAEAHEL